MVSPNPVTSTRPPRSRAERSRRTERARRSAAIALVCALAAGWFVTTHAGRAKAQAETRAAGGSAPPTTGAADGAPSLRKRVPVGAQCHDQGRSETALRCTVGGVDVEYELQSRPALRSAYLAAVGAASSPPVASRAGPACARGGEDERSWSRPGAPSRAVGRYACRVEQGRAAMWWTVDDRGLLAHAIARDADLTTLFAWWESHSER